MRVLLLAIAIGVSSTRFLGGEGGGFQDGETSSLNRKQDPATALLPQWEQARPKLSKEPSATLKLGKDYSHSSGLKLRFPADWKLVDSKKMLSLIPPDANNGESIFVMFQATGMETDPGSPESLLNLKVMIPPSESVVPVGWPRVVATAGGTGVFAAYQMYRSTLVYGFVTILGGQGVMLMAVGPNETIPKRFDQLNEIFSTFGWGLGPAEPSLVGTWTHLGYPGAPGLARGIKSSFTLHLDGSFNFESISEETPSVGNTNQFGDIRAAGNLVLRTGSGWKGKWTASNGTFILVFEDGTSEMFNYRLRQGEAGPVLVFKHNNRRETDWSRAG